METKIKLGFSEVENQTEEIVIDVKLTYNKSHLHLFLQEILDRNNIENKFKENLNKVINDIEEEKEIQLVIFDGPDTNLDKGLRKIIKKMDDRYISKVNSEDEEDDFPF